jgi:ASC-1-like (ASCH) protein
MSVVYNKNVSEPWFTLIKLGLKKCEGRLNKNNDFKYMRSCKCMITSIRDYDSFEKYLETETIKFIFNFF